MVLVESVPDHCSLIDCTDNAIALTRHTVAITHHLKIPTHLLHEVLSIWPQTHPFPAPPLLAPTPTIIQEHPHKVNHQGILVRRFLNEIGRGSAGQERHGMLRFEGVHEEGEERKQSVEYEV